MLKIGDIIYLPSNNQVRTYVIRTGDTLESIANRFNTTVENIMRINNLQTDDVTIGQVLIIS